MNLPFLGNPSGPLINFRTCGTLGRGVGGDHFEKLSIGFKRVGFNVCVDGKITPACDFIFVHLRPTKELERDIDAIDALFRRGQSPYIVIYLIEPLDLRESTWKSVCRRESVIKALSLADKIFVNSVGYFSSGQFVELAEFVQFLDKTELIRVCLLDEVHYGHPPKSHNTSDITAVWHGFSVNCTRWLKSQWPDVELDHELYPNAQKMLDRPNYGDLTTLDDSVRVVTIANKTASFSPTVLHPGERKIVAYLKRFDVGLAPFRTDTYRTICKPFGVKIQSYMVAGLPVIASPIPDYTDVIEDGVTGLLAESRNEWKSALNRLKDPVLRNKIARNARELVIAKYNRDTIIAKYEKSLSLLSS